MQHQERSPSADLLVNLFAAVVPVLRSAPQRQAVYMLRVLRAALEHLLFAPIGEAATLLARLRPATAASRATPRAAEGVQHDEPKLGTSASTGPPPRVPEEVAAERCRDMGSGEHFNGDASNESAASGASEAIADSAPVFAQLAGLALDAALGWFAGAQSLGRSHAGPWRPCKPPKSACNLYGLRGAGTVVPPADVLTAPCQNMPLLHAQGLGRKARRLTPRSASAASRRCSTPPCTPPSSRAPLAPPCSQRYTAPAAPCAAWCIAFCSSARRRCAWRT